MQTSKTVVSVRNLHKWYHDRHILKGVSFDIDAAKLICLIGRSGCGKSTILRCLNGLETLDQGSITVADKTLTRANRTTPIDAKFEHQAHDLRANVGMVFQSFNLFPHLSVIENVMKAQMVVKNLGFEEAEVTATRLLDKVGLKNHLHHHPFELSGGQQQRAAIARALAMSPKVMLYDEPTSALDPELVDEVLQVMKTLDQEDMTQIVVTHEMRFARDASDFVAYVEDGQIIEMAPPEKIFSNPDDDRTRQFLKKFL